MNRIIRVKKIAYLRLLCAVSLLLGRSDAKLPSSKSRSPSSSRDNIAVQGCVARSTGYYILMRTDPGNAYNLEEVNRTVKLESYLGEQVEVTGWQSPQLSNSSSFFYDTAPSAVTIMVTSIKAIAGRCTEGDISGSAVGHSTSVVSVAAGEHQVIAKKSGYKSLGKRTVITKRPHENTRRVGGRVELSGLSWL